MNLKLLTIANSFFLNKAEHKTLSTNKYENANYSNAAELSMNKVL